MVIFFNNVNNCKISKDNFNNFKYIYLGEYGVK